MLQSYNADSARRLITEVIDNKQWDMLLNPNVYGAMLHMYDSNTVNVSFFKKLKVDFNVATIKFVAILTLTTFVNSFIVVPVASLFFTLYREGFKILRSFEGINRLVIIALSIPIWYYTDNTTIACLFSQFGYLLFVNDFSFTIGKYISKKLWKKVKIEYKRNSHNAFSFIMTALHILVLKYMVDFNSALIYIFHVMYVVVTSYNTIRLIMTLLLLLSSSLSNFNPFHIIFNLVLIYVAVGRMDYSTIENIIGQIRNICACDWGFMRRSCSEDSLDQKYDYLDTHLYPSISEAPETDYIVRRNVHDHDKINNQVVEKRLENSAKFEKISNDEVFNFSSKEEFIDAIAEEDSEEEEIIEELEIESKDGSTYSVKRSGGAKRLSITRDYMN